MRTRSSLATWIWLAGMVAVFVGERLIGADTGRKVATGLGLAGVVIALALRARQMQRSTGEERMIHRMLLALYGAGLLALGLYFVQSDLVPSLAHDSPKLATCLAALWPAVWLMAALPILFAEISFQAVSHAPRLEHLRVRDALLSGVGVAGAAIFVFALGYVATERDHKVDFSYMRTAKAGESTKKIVAALDQPVQVSLFFPPASEVKEQVESYFADLKDASKQLEVKSYDHAVDPSKAKELGVSGNGVVVVGRGGRREQLNVGTELEAARDKLANLDKEIQKRLLQVARPGRTIYLTSGHGERSFDKANDTDQRLTVRDLRELLTQQGYAVRQLGAGEGLATDVPPDAAIVMVIGPQKPLLVEETQALARYFGRGGRLLVALDPDGPDPKELLAPLGLQYDAVPLANDQIFARRTNQASDRANIVSGSFSSHASVTTLGHLGMRAPMIFVAAGALEERKDRPKDVTIDFTVHAHPATWADANGNFQFDPGETRKAWELAAAIVKHRASDGKEAARDNAKEDARALALADSDALCDGVIGNPGNAYWVIDGSRWLLGDESISGEISSEVDVPVAHTRKQDVYWFYSSTFVGPALVLAIGYFASRRRRRQSSAATAKETK